MGSVSITGTGGLEQVFSYPMFRDLQREQTVFTGIAAHVGFWASLTYAGQTRSENGMLVSGNYFPVLGLKPALGRLFVPDDDRAVGESRIAVLSYQYWQSGFGADPGIVGETVIVSGEPLTVVGADFAARRWVPIHRCSYPSRSAGYCSPCCRRTMTLIGTATGLTCSRD